MSNELTEQMLADYKLHIKPERWEDTKRLLLWNVEEYGEIVSREKWLYPLDNSMYDYIYTYANGLIWKLDAVRMGLVGN